MTSNSQAAKKATPEERKKNLRYQRDKDREMVKGIFRYYEVPGGSMSFSFKKYREDPVERYDLVDGQQYTLPLGVAKHLNKNGTYPVYEHVPNEPGIQQAINPGGGAALNQNMRIGRKVQRFGFQSLEFVDIEGLEEDPGIFTVEKTV